MISRFLRSNKWFTRNVILTILGSSIFASGYVFTFQGTNNLIGKNLGLDFVAPLVLWLYIVGECSTIISGVLIRRYNAKVVTQTAVICMALGAWACAHATYSLLTMAAAYALYSAAHFAAFTAIATICRMSMPAEVNQQRRGGSVYGGASYILASLSGYAIPLVMTSVGVWERVSIGISLPILLILWFVKLPENMQPSTEYSLTVRGFARELFDFGSLRVVWPHSVIIVANTILLIFLPLTAGTDAGTLLFWYFLTCGVAGIFFPILIAERKSDWLSSQCSFLFAGSSMVLLFFGGGNYLLNLSAVILLGLSIGLSRVATSQLGADDAQLSGRGVSTFYSAGIKFGQLIGSALGLLRPWLGDWFWWTPIPLLVAAFVYMTIQKRQRNC
ncbi:hypothetical protein SAMN05444392_101893 [Seinonella peptonophila]|uniref:MFS transporter n=1 Tax=Seinonella peptonophila TaxID=112248 RepID=A0A1M4UAB5_9BACL|nr:hypothetical protein [Seinonella peptonophila]SHE53588.1 hypothetical protein SAMN05444392_101893 [Seinonella peptonophila]